MTLLQIAVCFSAVDLLQNLLQVVCWSAETYSTPRELIEWHL